MYNILKVMVVFTVNCDNNYFRFSCSCDDIVPSDRGAHDRGLPVDQLDLSGRRRNLNLNLDPDPAF